MAADQPLTLTVYGRACCHLCDQMVDALRVLQGAFPFEIAVIDVDSDPELERRHGERVPVLAHGAHELCHYRIEPDAITAYLSNFR